MSPEWDGPLRIAIALDTPGVQNKKQTRKIVNTCKYRLYPDVSTTWHA